MKRLYFDYAATTPIDARVVKAMRPFFSKKFANATALYKEGVEVKQALTDARKQVAAILNASYKEVFFTGSGTEANNLAILGVIGRYAHPHVVTTTIEHPSVLEVCKEVERRGGEVTVVPVDERGVVSARSIAESLKENTVLVSVMCANNEIGTIQPLKEIAKKIREHRKKYLHSKIVFHTDASQAANYLPLNVASLGVDLLTLDGSKIYGPKGVGMLYVKNGTDISPILFGGGQEGGIRSGTENMAGVVGFAKAFSITDESREKESKRLLVLRDMLIEKIAKAFPSSTLNGDQSERLVNNVNVCFPGVDAEFVVIKLDVEGVACSYSSSCRTLSENNRSYVLEAIGRGCCAESSLRFTLGRATTAKDIDRLMKILPRVL